MLGRNGAYLRKEVLPVTANEILNKGKAELKLVLAIALAIAMADIAKRNSGAVI